MPLHLKKITNSRFIFTSIRYTIREGLSDETETENIRFRLDIRTQLILMSRQKIRAIAAHVEMKTV